VALFPALGDRELQRGERALVLRSRQLSGSISGVKKPGVGSVRWVFVVALVMGCESEAGVTSPDGGVDAGCPDHVANDAGVVQLTRRGCPLTIDYSIR
jgi:hypothetical protein